MATITEDGITQILSAGPATVLYVTGSLGGGTATAGYIDDSEAFVAFTTGALAIGGQYKIDHGHDVQVAVQLTGSTTPTLKVDAKGVS